MHTTQLPSGALAHHNGDFSGDVIFHVESDRGPVDVSIPFDDLLHLVGSWKRAQLISELEEATPAQIVWETHGLPS